MTDFDNFTADLPGIQALAGFLGDRAADLRGIGTAIRSLPCASEDALGATDTLTAYTAFHGAWTTEITVYAGALDEVASKFSTAASTYSQQDVSWGSDFTTFVEGTALD